ncbi:transposase [Streptomyces hirsutus]|nr:transposase [Streptomyces hirsutus]
MAEWRDEVAQRVDFPEPEPRTIAALACHKPGERSRLICRPCPDARPDGGKSFSWKDHRDLLQTAHQQLGGPIVLIWNHLNTHLTAGMRRYLTDRDWLTVVQLPPYAPDFNPVEGIWSVPRRTTAANRAFADPDELITAVRRGLRRLQYRHDVLDGCLVGTGPPKPATMTTTRIQGQWC